MKIKKYTSSIIILIMLIGIFIPVLGVHASDVDYNELFGGGPVQSQPPCNAFSGLGKLICQVQQILNSIIPVLVALGVVYFVWGVVQYVIADGEEAKKTGKDRIIYGIIGFAVIVGLWGLVNIVVKTFGLGASVAPKLASLTGTSATCSLVGNPKFQDVLCYITGIISNSVIPLIFALATVMFVWGVVQFFILNADEEKKRPKASNL